MIIYYLKAYNSVPIICIKDNYLKLELFYMEIRPNR